MKRFLKAFVVILGFILLCISLLAGIAALCVHHPIAGSLIIVVLAAATLAAMVIHD